MYICIQDCPWSSTFTITSGSTVASSSVISAIGPFTQALTFTPGADTACISVTGTGTAFRLFSITLPRVDSFILRDAVTLVCNEDQYHFGYNGQMKVNEVAGVGNWTTAKYWEYGTREARRKNRDPVSIPSESPYAANRNNPINNNDPNGDCPNCVTALGGAIIGAVVGGGIEIATQLYHNGSVSNWTAVGGASAQGAITGAVAGFTGGASLLVSSAATGVANGVGGAVNNAIQGKEITASSVTTDVAVGVAFGVAGKLAGQAQRKVPTANQIFTKSIATRDLAEEYATATKYTQFSNINKVKPHNLTFDLIDKANNVVDVTTTDAKVINASQFTKKLFNLSKLDQSFNNRTLQIYLKEGQYSQQELNSLRSKLNSFINDNLKGKNVNFSIDKIKK